MDDESFHHVPVLLDRVVELLAAVPDGRFVDATLGGGGHAAAVLAAHPGLELIGIDRDDAALAAAAVRLAPFSDRTQLVRASAGDLLEVVGDHPPVHRSTNRKGVSAVLLDLGVSSPQLDHADRGFSYRSAGPLDMRMDRSQGFTADDVVNHYDYAALARIIRDNSDERFASRIARAIVAARPIEDSAHLARVVRDAIPAAARRTGGHPAKRTFQAIRMEVNAELDQLAAALDDAVALLQPGGRLAVLAYHSLEDRMVKDRFADAASGGCECPVGLPCVCGAEPTVRLLRRGAWKASAEEVAVNRRAESVRLRAVERLGEPA
ncbi:MAG: 16S rRNA (cytosine(1402)-N(4))-methyltransferase RsmH [Actinomycetota bacterium]